MQITSPKKVSATGRALARGCRAIVIGCICAAASASAQAELLTFATILSPDNEIPPITSPSTASGQGFFFLDTETRLFSWSVVFKDLSIFGVTPGAYIHSQADGTTPGEDVGPIILDFDRDPGAYLTGSEQAAGAFLGARQLSELSADSLFVGGLLDGLWYVNIHTSLNEAGEIRGQILPGGVAVVPLPPAFWFMVSAVGLLATQRRRCHR